jgi:hypothetical protein
MVSSQPAEGAPLRYPPTIGSQDDEVEYQSVKPTHHPCPPCGKKGKRQPVITRRIAHVAALPRRSWRVAEVGVDQARCECCKYCQAPIAGVPPRGRSSLEVRNTVAHSLMRDRMPDLSVSRRRQAEYRWTLSLGSIHACLRWAQAQLNMETHWNFVRATFSGVLGRDAVHDRGRTLLFATDPLGDLTVPFQLVEKNDHDHMGACVQALKARGLDARGVMSAGSPLYQDALPRYGADVEQHRCIFHVIQEVNKLLLDGVRAIKNRIKRQGTKGRKKRRGRPTKQAQPRRQHRRGMSKHEPGPFIWEHQYLIVRKADDLREQGQAALALLFQIAPALKLFRQCNQQFDRLFDKGLTKQGARARRARMASDPLYQAPTLRAKALKKISKDKFDKMIGFLGWANGQRTDHHVERNNRGVRMMQQTRYKRRQPHTIAKALELELYARRLEHPLDPDKISALSVRAQQATILKMAA